MVKIGVYYKTILYVSRFMQLKKLMRVLILCVWLVLTQHTWAHPDTKKLFYNLPIETGERATQDSLLHDTLNFETKKVYRSKNNQLITINTYYAKTILNFY